MSSFEIYSEHDGDCCTWKIPRVSSISHVVDHVVQSPSFLFGGTSWTLKMYPNGDSLENEGHVSLVIERLETQGDVSCYLYYKNIFNTDIFLCSDVIYNYETEIPIPRLMRSLNKISEDSDIVIDDTFYLVIELSQVTSSESISPTISASGTVGTTGGRESVVGEIFKEYEGGKWIDCTVFDIPSELPCDYLIESPQFSFLNGKWILKLRPYYRMENSQQRSFDIVLERQESEVPVHHVLFGILLSYPEDATKEEFLTFDSRRVQSPGLKFHLNKSNEPKLELNIEIKALKSTRICLDPQEKSVEISSVYDKDPELSMMSLKSKALQDYKTMFFEKADCDVTFRVKERELYAHKLILKYRSPVLASAMRYDMKEKITGVIEIEDCDPEHFSDFLYFIYCGEVENLRIENVFSLFTLADKYEVLDLRNVCLKFIKRNITVDSFCDTLTLALLHSEADLIKLSTEFFVKNIKQVIVTVKWQNFLVENPIQANELFIKAHNV